MSNLQMHFRSMARNNLWSNHRLHGRPETRAASVRPDGGITPYRSASPVTRSASSSRGATTRGKVPTIEVRT